MLNIGRHFLKKQQHEELRCLRKEQPKRKKPLPRFATWLTERNRRARVLWRYRRRIKIGMDIRQLEKPFEFPKIGNLDSPYLAYRELLMKQYPEKIDASQLDAIIALRMRLAGYTPQNVANEMYHKARPLRKEQENRDWKDYARRTAWYAFGVAGDIDIATAEPTPEKILSFHQEAERLEAARTGTVEAERETPRLRMR
jgi:hypothetical protein